jgi:hypothetical protein
MVILASSSSLDGFVSVTQAWDVVICAATNPFRPELPFASASTMITSVSSILLHV